jgi:hypothetical protein
MWRIARPQTRIQVAIPGLRGWSDAAVWKPLWCANVHGQKFGAGRVHGFEAGTHADAIKLRYYDYEKIVQPRVEDFAIKLQPMKGE